MLAGVSRVDQYKGESVGELSNRLLFENVGLFQFSIIDFSGLFIRSENTCNWTVSFLSVP